jgi:hypothetical protein
MDGTAYEGAIDPRMTRMLAQDSTGAYRGVDPMVGYSSVMAERPWNLWGYFGTFRQSLGRYLFDDKVKFPIMSYAQLQFIKAEAALHMGDQGTARDAYLKRRIPTHRRSQHRQRQHSWRTRRLRRRRLRCRTSWGKSSLRSGRGLTRSCGSTCVVTTTRIGTP